MVEAIRDPGMRHSGDDSQSHAGPLLQVVRLRLGARYPQNALRLLKSLHVRTASEECISASARAQIMDVRSRTPGTATPGSRTCPRTSGLPRATDSPAESITPRAIKLHRHQRCLHRPHSFPHPMRVAHLSPARQHLRFIAPVFREHSQPPRATRSQRTRKRTLDMMA
jgi:hypothetical protein